MADEGAPCRRPFACAGSGQPQFWQSFRRSIGTASDAGDQQMHEAGKLGLGAIALIALCASGTVAQGAPSSGGSRAAPRGLQLAALFGESDEERAARQQHEDNQDL